MRKYILQLIDKEINQLKAILRLLNFKVEREGNKNLQPLIKKTEAKLLTAERHKVKFLKSNVAP